MAVALIVAVFAVEALGAFGVAAVHLGIAIDVPGYVQPQASAAAVSALCGLAFVAAAWALASRRANAWQIGVGAQAACVAGMLIIDKVLAAADGTPIYRIGIAAAGVVGILLMTASVKSALGRDAREDVADKRGGFGDG